MHAHSPDFRCQIGRQAPLKSKHDRTCRKKVPSKTRIDCQSARSLKRFGPRPRRPITGNIGTKETREVVPVLYVPKSLAIGIKSHKVTDTSTPAKHKKSFLPVVHQPIGSQRVQKADALNVLQYRHPVVSSMGHSGRFCAHTLHANRMIVKTIVSRRKVFIDLPP